jgi:two-component sensor histidine kinase
MADERRQADSAPADDPAPADKRPPATARPRPVAHYLTFLVLVCLLPAFTFSAYLLIRTNSVQQEGLQTLFQANTRSLVQLLDQEVASMLTTLRVLSSDSAFRTGDLETFHRRARNALIGREMFLVILDDDLTPQLSTAIEFGTPLPPVSDRTTPRRALENRAPVVSDVVFTQAILDWIFFTALPIYAEGRDPVLMLTVRRTDSLDDVLDANRLPGAWQVAIVDSSRNLVSTTDPSLRPGGALPFVFPEDLVNGVGEVEIGGSSFRVIEEHSALTQWSVIAWAPNATITAPVWRSIVLLVAGGIAFGLIAAGSAWFVGRRIARSARRLSANAERLGAGDPVQNDPHSIEEFAVISSAMIHAAQNREEAESEIRLLMREVAHRSKNQLTVINAMVGQTAKNAASVDEFVDGFRRRISGLARSTDLLLANTARGVDFRSLVESQLEPFAPNDPQRVRLAGPTIRVDAQPAQTIGMAIHELATNAAKYGALSDDVSRLEITWWKREGNMSLTWREHVRELAPRAERKGFGSVVLERMMGGSLAADIDRTMHGDGIEWHFNIPLNRLKTEPDA